MPRIYRVKRHAITQPSDQSYRLIALTQNQTALVDTQDFERLTQWRWQAHWNPHTKSFYAFRSDGTYMHRLILGCEQTEQVDHKNHNTLDNRRTNLRKCTNALNHRNMRRKSNNRTGFKGIYWDKRSKTWVTRVQVDGRAIYIGNFGAAEQAAHAYDDAAKRFHGEFAHLNFS